MNRGDNVGNGRAFASFRTVCRRLLRRPMLPQPDYRKKAMNQKTLDTFLECLSYACPDVEWSGKLRDEPAAPPVTHLDDMAAALALPPDVAPIPCPSCSQDTTVPAGDAGEAVCCHTCGKPLA